MEEQKIINYSRKKILPAFLVVIIGAIALYLIMNAVQPYLLNNHYLYDFGALMGGCIKGSIFYRVMWIFADLTEGTFLASLPAAVLMVVMGCIACNLERKKSKYAGTGVDGNSKVFPAMLICSVISLVLGQLIYGSFFSSGWIPTFAAFLPVQVFITFYGADIKKLITITLLGTIITFPACFYILKYIVAPLKLPLFVSVAFGLVVAVPLCTAIFGLMPWMTKKQPEPANDTVKAPAVQSEFKFFTHRVFGDIGELVIWGSSLSVIGMYIGAIISWLLNPMHPAYSAGNLPMTILAQVSTAAIAIFIWYPKWKANGWAFTFAGVAFTSAVVSSYSNAWQIVIPTIIIGALVFAPLLDWLLKAIKYNGRIHVIFYIQICIGVVCTLWSFIIMYVLIPLFKLV